MGFFLSGLCLHFFLIQINNTTEPAAHPKEFTFGQELLLNESIPRKNIVVDKLLGQSYGLGFACTMKWALALFVCVTQ